MAKNEAATPAQEAPNVLDLAVFDVLTKSNEGVEIELLSPKDATPTGVFFRVLGRDSDAFREINFKHQTKKMNRMSKNGGKLIYDAEELDDEGLEVLACCVTSWSIGKEPWTGKIVFAGEELACTRDNVLKVLRKVPPFREQVDIAVGDRSNFLKG